MIYKGREELEVRLSGQRHALSSHPLSFCVSGSYGCIEPNNFAPARHDAQQSDN